MGITEGGKIRQGLGRIANSLRRRREIPANQPEEREREKRFGMRLSDLTEKVFIDVLEIYDGVAGTQIAENRRTFPDKIELDLDRVRTELSSTVHWRFGSNLSHNSRLTMRSAGLSGEDDILLKVLFEPQDDTGNGDSEEGKEMRTLFRSRVEIYLQDNGLAVGLVYPYNLG